MLFPAIMAIGTFSSVFTMVTLLASGRFILALPSYILMGMMSLLAESENFLPFSQSMQLAAGNVAHPLRLSLYSMIIVFSTTLMGILLFRRKDIA